MAVVALVLRMLLDLPQLAIIPMARSIVEVAMTIAEVFR